jgi:hypothetical protein
MAVIGGRRFRVERCGRAHWTMMTPVHNDRDMTPTVDGAPVAARRRPVIAVGCDGAHDHRRGLPAPAMMGG